MEQEQRIQNPMPAATAAPSPAAVRPPPEGTAKNPSPKKPTAKGGAPALNTNRQRSGLHSRPEVVAMRFELGTLGGSKKRIECDTYAFRRLLENSVLDVKGSISLIDAATIQTACRHERASRLALAWLREHEKELSHAERLAYNKAVADFSSARDKALERLKIDTDATAWQPGDLYRMPRLPPVDSQASDTRTIDGPCETLDGQGNAVANAAV